MRAGPLSDEKVIKLLNGYFVPVYSSIEESGPRGNGPASEKAELRRIYMEARQSPCGAGDVYVYILSPDGKVIDGGAVSQVTHGDALATMLERDSQSLHTVFGPPVVPPSPQSYPPDHPSDSIVLHLIAKGTATVFPWREFPAENWIILSHDEWTTILPPNGAKVSSSWTLNDQLTRKLLSNFYPQMEDSEPGVDRNRIDEAGLKATVVSVSDGSIQARLDGTLVMKRTFFPHQEDNNFVHAIVVGWVVFDSSHSHINSLQIVTKTATYGSTREEEFKAALFSLSPSDLTANQSGP
jgi:hypothetical protein